MSYDIGQAILPDLPGAGDKDRIVLSSADEMAEIAAANELAPMVLDDAEVAALVAFLESLTDPASRTGRLGVPDSVPSGLPLD